MERLHVLLTRQAWYLQSRLRVTRHGMQRQLLATAAHQQSRLHPQRLEITQVTFLLQVQTVVLTSNLGLDICENRLQKGLSARRGLLVCNRGVRGTSTKNYFSILAAAAIIIMAFYPGTVSAQLRTGTPHNRKIQRYKGFGQRGRPYRTAAVS